MKPVTQQIQLIIRLIQASWLAKIVSVLDFLILLFYQIGRKGRSFFIFGILGLVSILIPENQYFEDINLLYIIIHAINN